MRTDGSDFMSLTDRLDGMQLSESDRRMAKARLRQAEALADTAFRVIVAIRSLFGRPQR